MTIRAFAAAALSTSVAYIAMSADGDLHKISSIKINDDGKVKAESVAIEESTNLVHLVVDAVTNSEDIAESKAFTVFARKTRGDNLYTVNPKGAKLAYQSEDGGGSFDADSDSFHFTVERYWTNDVDCLIAQVTDATFDSADAAATWRLYEDGALVGEVSGTVSSRLLDFGDGITVTYSPLETVVYSDEFTSVTNAMWKQIKSVSPQFTIRPEVGDDGKISYVLFSDAQQGN